MSYSTSAEAFHGKTPIVLLTLTIGATVYRWSTHDVSTPDGMYQGRIVDGGSIDREVVSGRPAGSDISMTISNHDGTLDALVSDFSANSYIKGTAVIKRGFEDLAFASFETKATLDVASIRGYSDSRLVVLNMDNERKFLTGTIEPPTILEVLDALKVADATNFPSTVKANPAFQDESVPIVVGSPFGISNRSGMINARVSTLNHTGVVGTLPAFSGYIVFAAISKYGFNVYDGHPVYNGAFYRVDGVPNAHESDYVNPNAFLSTFAAQNKAITLNGETWHVLLLKAEQFAFDTLVDGTLDIKVRPQPKFEGVSDPRPWTVAETAQGLFESATGNEGTWSSNSVTATWTELTDTTDITSRYISTQDTDVMSAIGTVVSESFIDTYVSIDGKLGVVNISPIGGPSSDYSANTGLVSEEDNIIAFNVSYPQPGSKWGVATRVNVGWGDNPGTAGDGVVRQTEVEGQYLLEDRISGTAQNPIRSLTKSNPTAETAHGREILVQLGGRTIQSRGTAELVAERSLALRSVPRPIISTIATIQATQIELGDVIRVKHSAAPWSGEHVGVVYGINDNLNDHTVNLQIVDLDSYLNGKTFFYNTRASWTHADTISPNFGAALSITNGSNAVIATIPNTFAGVMVGDILRLDTQFNRFEVIIASTDQDDFLTTSNNGGAWGPTNGNYVTEGSITNWKILRSQATRGTTPDKAGAPINEKYGAYANTADELFLDDVTVPYIYR